MSDLIDRQEAIKAMTSGVILVTNNNVDAVKKVMELFIDKIKNLPAAQPDIIACGDCIHWICHDRRCGYWNHGVKPLDWCCHAERRTDG